MSEQDAQDINQMMSSNSEVPIALPKKSKFIWVVLGCMVLGVGLGVVVYQQSIQAPTPSTKPTSKPVQTATPSSVVPSVTPLLSPAPAVVSEISPSSNLISFPKTGELRVYSDIGALTIEVTVEGKMTKISIPAGNPTDPMKYVDTGIKLTKATDVSIKSYLTSSPTKISRGWIAPSTANKCGANGFELKDVAPKLTYVTSLIQSEPMVSKQCWSDYDPPNNKGETSAADFNDYFLVWSYKPGTVAASTVASASPSVSPSPSPSPSRAASPSPSPSVKASVVATPTPTPVASPRVSMPDTTEGTPVTGIFEITVGTISVGIVFLLLGLVGLLVL